MTARTTATAPDGTPYRDLNGNGRLDPYEDRRLPTSARVRDLIGRMVLEEKAGLLFHTTIEPGDDGSLVEQPAVLGGPGTSELVVQRHIRHFNVPFFPSEVGLLAQWNNQIQEMAESTRLGIPVTISTDPCHSNVQDLGLAVSASGRFSTWPHTLGLAAMGDLEAIRDFAETAREEYRAVGLRTALHPQIDLATEPRWARLAGTLGADPAFVSDAVRAYLAGFQGESLTGGSVACMTKHFPGGGPQRDGEDPHFPYGREQVYPAGRFEEHLEPFRAAIEAGTAAMMPYYGMPVGLVRKGRAIEEVGFGFNKQIITDLLRDELGYDGVVCTDWQLVRDHPRAGSLLPAKAWGVEHLDATERVQKILDAGCDQLGGEHCTEIVVSLVEAGLVTEQRLDESVARILTVTFELGLFDDPYVDEAGAADKLGTDEAVSRTLAAQVASAVVLVDRPVEPPLLPLPAGTRVHVDGADWSGHGAPLELVDRPADADVVVVRLPCPYTPRDQYALDPFIRAGTLEFDPATVDRVRALAEEAPVILDVELTRGAVLSPLVDVVTVLIGSFGTSDRAFAHALTTDGSFTGRLPFDLPRSQDVADHHRPDSPMDVGDALFAAGHTARA